ncbi:MAG: TerB family tellurite resistance protein [bacterium]|nr:TerB family tellurite resistance protein [bacterium]
MINSFNRDEKKTLIAILKFMVHTEGIMSETDLETFNAVAEEKGFNDFQEIFEEVDAEIKTFDDIYELITKVTDDSHKKDIISYAVDIATADGNINPDEAYILKVMNTEWKVE